MNADDRELGMDRNITRRDFLNGAGIALTGALILPAGDSSPFGARSAAQASGPYPPSLTGLQGNPLGSEEAAHQLRAGAKFENASDTGER